MEDLLLAVLVNHIHTLAGRLHDPDRPDPLADSRRLRGDVGAMTTEAVIIIAGLAALALAVVAIIVTKVTAKAKSIPTN
jgi:hypothetical protein